MKIKLVTPERFFVPDVSFDTEADGVVKNRSLPVKDQIRCEIKIATLAQKSVYLNSYAVTGKKASGEIKSYTSLEYEKCVQKHCLKIEGLEDFGITNGKTLVDHEPVPVLNEMIREIFLKVNGIHDDDDPENEDSGDAGALSEGESVASE